MFSKAYDDMSCGFLLFLGITLGQERWLIMCCVRLAGVRSIVTHGDFIFYSPRLEILLVWDLRKLDFEP